MSARCYHLAELFEAVADAVPERTVLVAKGERRSFAELDERANRCAQHLLAAGLAPGAHVGVYARNRIEWVEAMVGAFKADLVPININYRYTAPELRHIFDNADLAGLVYEHGYSDLVAEVAAAAPGLQARLVLADETGGTAAGDPEWEAALAAATPTRAGLPERSGDSRYILYTGGTTGMPKGVIWRHEDIFFGALQGGNPGGEPVGAPGALGDLVRGNAPLVSVACTPMMHGGGQWCTLIAALSGGCCILYCEERFSPEAVLRLIERERPVSLTVIGDAMARPLAEELARGDYDLSSLAAWCSGGAQLTAPVCEQIKRLLPEVIILDTFGASETGSLGAGNNARFSMKADTEVLDEHSLAPVPPGGEGLLAISGHIPLGYYRDAQKTAATFRADGDGRRWSLPGDRARRLEDGGIQLLGRSSACINSGGEKIFPEEVEAALKGHPEVYDAVVIGSPHPRFGEQVTALVEARPGTSPTLAGLRAHCLAHVADYKRPRRLLLVDKVPRTVVAKPDYRAARQLAQEARGGEELD